MGRAGKWFRSLFSYLKPHDSSPPKEKKKRAANRSSLSASADVGDPMASPFVGGIDANRHAIAVAAATAAVAEAALTAAQAAAEVVRLTSGGRSGRGAPEASGDRRRAVAAAVKIQSAFRAYLARKALKALKGLVKLQALVRGYIVRKQSTDMLRRMHAMARIQARASKHRSYPPESPYAKNNFSNSHHPGITNTRRYEGMSNSTVYDGSLIKPDHYRSHSGISTNKESSQIASRWLNHWMEQCASEKTLHETSLDKRSDKILEIDTWKPHPSKTRTDQITPTSHYFSAWNESGPEYTIAGPVSRPSSKHHKPNPSVSSEDDQVPGCVADVSPRVHSSSSCRPSGNSRGPSFTPTRSECSRSLFGEYIGGHPSYMAYTESSRAKVRSYSAPKQRMQREGLGANIGGGDFWECSDTFSEKGLFLPGNNRGGNYRYSGQVKRQGTPARDAGIGFSSVYGRRR